MATCIIFNPTARGARARRWLDHLPRWGFDGEFMPTFARDSGRELAHQAVLKGFDTIIAAGGDGTVNEVINGIVDAGGCDRARLGILPVGTANVFARQLRIPLDFTSAWRVCWAGSETRIDLPCADFEAEGVAQRRCFIQLAGAGLDAQAIALVDWETKKQLGFASYVWAGLKALSQPQSPLRIIGDEGSFHGELVLIGNGNYYGGQFNLFPRADMADGKLDALIFPRVRWLTLAALARGWMTDRIHLADDAITVQTRHLRVESDARQLFELDGDNVGSTPVTFSLLPQKLRVITPP